MIVLSGKAVGEGHRAEGIRCQDFLRFKRVPPNNLVFALADGAGSAKSSLFGAVVASVTFILAAEREIMIGDVEVEGLRGVVERCFVQTRRELELMARKKAYRLEDLHSTLFAGIYYNGVLVCGGVGDSLGLVVTRSGDLLFPVSPSKGEYINETAFITMDGWQNFLSLSEGIQDPTGLLVFSDGLMNILYGMKYDRGEWRVIPDRELVYRLIDHVREKRDEALLNRELFEMLSSSKAQKMNDDDKSLILVLFDEEARSET